MKSTTAISLIILLVLASALMVLTGSACQTTGNTNLTNTTSQANTNRMTNMNMATGNANSMPSNMSNMPMNGNSNMSGMSSDMMKSSANASSAPYDLQFIDTMTPHHQSAVEMAEMAETKSNNPELKKFAHQIIDDQKKEIAIMKEWREKWFAGKPQAMNMEMPGMRDSMKGMDMSKMQAATGKDFDVQFLEMMTPHHAGAISMAREALTKAEHPEIKTLANQIIKAQEAEIAQMNQWKAKWAK